MLPVACKDCLARYLGQYCGLAYSKESGIAATALRRLDGSRVPEGCPNGFGSMNSKEVKEDLGV